MKRLLLNKKVALEKGIYKKFPEKVLQFGTGALLRGLPDFFIHKANEQGIFEGSIVIVKSTTKGNLGDFSAQDNLFTHCTKGIYNGQLVNDTFINTSISRVLEARTEWDKLLALAVSENIEIIISNTTEAGLVLDKQDSLGPESPNSFPGKLFALLYARYQHFNGDINKGWVILPTELIPDNATFLKSIIKELIQIHKLPHEFMTWLDSANEFCNTLVDRIVPGKLNENEMLELEEKLGYEDKLLISSEPFALWAIESNKPFTIAKIAFATFDERVIVTSEIVKFRELKLRLLNGAHTFSCAVAIMAGFETVIQAMENKAFNSFMFSLALDEIAPCVVGGNISEVDASTFAKSVLERFSNPFIEHKWTNISMNFEEKMKMRNQYLMEKYASNSSTTSEKMSLGFAAFALYMSKEHDKIINTAEFCADTKFIDKVEVWKTHINSVGMKTILGI
jgi:tagaturonate reductase